MSLPDLRPSDYAGYNGNLNLKRANTAINWTPEHVKEYVKCSRDPIYFTKNYMKLISLDKGLVPFNLFDYQEHALEAAMRERRMVMLTARQSGKTSFATAFILHTIIFNEHKTVALLANKGDTAREILDRVQLAYEHLPFWLQQGVIEWNKGSLELENGCKVIAAATSGSAIRGKSINILYIDEAAFVENWDEFFASVYPTISAGADTKLILTSTPNGLNHFYHIWQGANDKDNPNGYYPIKVLWHEVPGRDDKWKEDALKALNYDYVKFDQEYNAEFMGSSGTLISGASLKRLKPMIPITTPSDGFYQYETVQKDHKYVMCVDVSRGKGLDYSAFQLIDITEMPFKQVAAYKNNLVTPMDYASVIYQIAKTYNNAHVLVEINDIGGQVADALHFDYAYEYIIYTRSAGPGGRQVSLGFSGNNQDRGLRTTVKTKTIGCSILKLLIEQDKLKVYDENTITELSVFSKKGDTGFKYEAEAGYHDDLVMCLVLFGWLSDQQFIRDINNINTLHAARDKEDESIYDELTPFGVVNNGLLPRYEKFDGDDSLWVAAEPSDLFF